MTSNAKWSLGSVAFLCAILLMWTTSSRIRLSRPHPALTLPTSSDYEVESMGSMPAPPEGENWGEVKFLRLIDNGSAVASANSSGHRPDRKAAHVRCLVYRAGKLTDIGTLGGDDCHPTDMNDRGLVVGYSTLGPVGAPLTVPSSDAHAFVWDGHRMSDLNPKDALSSAAFGIDGSNRVFGRIDYARYSILAFWEHGRIVEAGEASDYLVQGNGLSRKGSSLILFENMSNGGELEPYLWKGGNFLPLSSPEALFTANSINTEGVVVGSIVLRTEASTADGQHAAIYRNGRIEKVEELRAGSSVLTDSNGAGEAVGDMWPHAEQKPHAFIWARGKSTDLSLRLPGLLFLDCINNRGEMIGVGYVQGDTPGGSCWLIKPKTHIGRNIPITIRKVVR